MNAVSIKLRATDAGNSVRNISIFINEPGRAWRQRMRAHVDHSMRDTRVLLSAYAARFSLFFCLSLSLSDHPFDFILNGRFFFFFVRRGSNETKPIRLFYDSLNESLCVHSVYLTQCQHLRIARYRLEIIYRSFKFDNSSEICTFV